MDGDPKLIVKNELPQDRINNRNMFDTSVSKWEIFYRNLIAGVGRALGGMLIYLAFLFIVGGIMGQLVLPVLKPYLETYMSVLGSFNGINGN